nr:phosphoribosyltransferase family protein [uncultured Agathobaculum sp.]
MGVLFAKRCVLCGELLPAAGTGKAMLCSACASEVRQRYRCTQTPHVTGADDAAAALYYTGKVRDAMQRFKFQHKQHYADWFAAQMLPLLTERLDIWQPDLITFMPIGWLRGRERGYNQAELLAKAVAEPLGLPCRATLRKRAFTPKQSEQKDAAARQKNAERALMPLANAEVRGKSLVLVDDIVTTGATAASAVRLLRKMGAVKVYVLAAARTLGK